MITLFVILSLASIAALPLPSIGYAEFFIFSDSKCQILAGFPGVFNISNTCWALGTNQSLSPQSWDGILVVTANIYNTTSNCTGASISANYNIDGQCFQNPFNPNTYVAAGMLAIPFPSYVC